MFQTTNQLILLFFGMYIDLCRSETLQNPSRNHGNSWASQVEIQVLPDGTHPQ